MFFNKIIQTSDLLLTTYASLYYSLQDMLSKIKEFDELEQASHPAKLTIPNSTTWK